MYFLFYSLLYTGLVTLYWYIVYLSFLIYKTMMYISSPICPCVISSLSLYTCFFMYTIFVSVSHIMPWWVLFRCFKKTGCESLPCHELSSYKVFQEFVLGLDLFYISTSDYEFSDLRLLSWFIYLLWFCHELTKGKIVRNIFM